MFLYFGCFAALYFELILFRPITKDCATFHFVLKATFLQHRMLRKRAAAAKCIMIFVLVTSKAMFSIGNGLLGVGVRVVNECARLLLFFRDL
jgi:hypothetical protein